MIERPIIALDFSTKVEIVPFLKKFPSEESLFVKVGMELFYQEGPDIVRFLKASGHDIFLDLKLHDIPNTVERAMKGLAQLGVSLTNVHAAGGKEMMAAAVSGLIAGSSQQKVPQLIAVTQLTSTSQKQMQSEQLIETTLIDSVCHYALLAQAAGLDGVVCSALEATAIHQKTSEDFICVTPGIRPDLAKIEDQKRVVTPSKARALGANAIVVGRPITKAQDPYQMYRSIKKEWSEKNDNFTN